MRILFFIGSLRTGGKERRLIELLTWLKQQRAFELFVVLAFDHIDYPAFHKLEIEHVILNKKPNLKDPRVFMRLYKLCKSFKPDVLHTWGSMQAFYLAPIAKILKVPLVNSQITSARPKRKKFNFSGLINSFNFLLSDKILSNSIAGLESFGLSKSDKKCKVIYNGFNPERIQNLPTKAECRKKFGIETNYAVVMVGSFSENKDYQRLLDVCRHIIRALRSMYIARISFRCNLIDRINQISGDIRVSIFIYCQCRRGVFDKKGKDPLIRKGSDIFFHKTGNMVKTSFEFRKNNKVLVNHNCLI